MPPIPYAPFRSVLAPLCQHKQDTWMIYNDRNGISQQPGCWDSSEVLAGPLSGKGQTVLYFVAASSRITAFLHDFLPASATC